MAYKRNQLEPLILFVVVGLGNSPEKYHRTYHNVGFLFVDYLAEKHGAQWSLNNKIPAQLCRTPIEELRINLLAKGEGFMNKSGHRVQSLLQYYNLAPEQLIVAHDDSDIAMGEYKISTAGGSAGHKGVQSVITALGTRQFDRIRIGIRPTEEQTRKKAESFVLKKISSNHFSKLEKVFEKIEKDLRRR